MTDKKLNENSLDVLLEDFAKHNNRMKTAPKTEMNHKMSLKERAILGLEALAKQLPTTLSQKRAQALSVMMWNVSGNKQRGEAIKYNLRMYFPQLSEEQIEVGLIKLYSIYNESVI